MSTLVPLRARGPKRHDCGQAGWLTVREIMQRTGRSENAIYNRLRKGVSGDSLLARSLNTGNWKNRGEPSRHREQARTTGSVMIAMAFRVATAFPNRTPTADDLQRRFGMSRATAYRWLRAILDVKGEGALA